MEGTCQNLILTLFVILAKAQGLIFVKLLGENVKSYAL
jgi:hypothetical protein